MSQLRQVCLFSIVLFAITACGGGSSSGGSGGGGNQNTPCPAPVQIQPDSVTQGSLATSDCSVVRLFPTEAGDQSLLDQYVVTLPIDGELTVRMESTQFDAFLAVFASNPPTGTPAYEDDDGGGNLDAMLIMQLDAGTYVIIANSATITAVTGSYTLTTSFKPAVWSPTSITSAPAPRTNHSAVWTGPEMIVWGGDDANAIAKNDGGRYDLQARSWTATQMTGAPAARSQHTVNWNGTEMLVWGGFSGAPGFVALGDGARYSPQTDSWTAISSVDAPSPRLGHTSIWTGDEMIIWGGFSCTACANGELGTGGRYSPATDSWTPVSMVGAPAARGNHSVIWTGSHMIVWGGENDGGNASLTLLNSGGSYDPDTDTWTPLSLVSAPLPTRCHSAIWTGTGMLVFGGQNDGNLGCGISTTNALASYDPVTDTWTDLVDAPVSSSISGPRAIWSGDRMIVWFESTGARYDPVTDSWSGIDPAGAPESRRHHTLLWTGDDMVTWGGDFAGPLDSGGVYRPAFDLTP